MQHEYSRSRINNTNY
ncbi:hypothetical protein ACIN5065_0563 [Acinetobacter baumannii OIFC065]|nr:hypothetical protein ACIN5065_0563 [Acinetobacter baumannii OIFC065]